MKKDIKTESFTKLIQAITGRDLEINTSTDYLEAETEYNVFRILPISKRKISFKWKTPKTEEKFMRSFITAFTTKYKEPDPAAYPGTYPGSTKWEDKTEKEREFAYYHHSSNMYHKKELLEQIEKNFSKSEITDTLCRYGFYPTEYGVGIFCFFATDEVMKAIKKMVDFLNDKNIPFKNEFSDAKWVFRFKINLSKEQHKKILSSFN